MVFRWLSPLRRKSRTLFIALVCLSLTAFIAIHNRPEGLQSFRRSVNRQVVGEIETDNTPVEAKHACYQSYQDEAKADFNTRDIFIQLITGSKPPKSSRNIPPATKEKLQVFVVPFTHVDPGWLRTFDSYSEDTNKILNNMHQFMKTNPKMRFIWAEFVFFERWWATQKAEVKEDVKKFVKEGRLELASGSWVMTDEANAYYPVSVDNIVEGHQFLQKEFGVLPKTIWSNDPFGYSNSVPYLFARAGLKRNVINRIHHEIKGYLQEQRAVPFQWRQFFDPKGENDILTQVLPYTHYDVLNSCGPNPQVCCEFDFKRMTHWGCGGTNPQNITKTNVKSQATKLVDSLKKMSGMYESNVILMMHGDDFRFDMIEEWHQQHDNFLPLFEEINKGSQVQIQFGTFTDYFNALEEWYKKNKKAPAKLSGDFFPYRCALGSYWTGYFTTRPFYKRQGRILHASLRAADLLLTSRWKTLSPEVRSEASSKLTKARRTLSLFQHHDAITGTSKKSVMKDYSELLFKSLELSNSVIETVKSAKSPFTLTEAPFKYDETSTPKLLELTKKKILTLSVFNTLPYKRPEVVSVRVDTVDVAVHSGDTLLLAQIEPFVSNGKVDRDSFILSFGVQLSALSTQEYTLSISDDSSPKRSSQIAEVIVPEHTYGMTQNLFPKVFPSSPIAMRDFGISTRRVKTKHSEDGSIQKVLTPAVTNFTTLSQRFSTYEGARGGAYIMMVDAKENKYDYNVDRVFMVRGPIRQSVYVIGKDIVQHSLTVNELEGTAGEQLHWDVRVDITQRRNTELATRFECGLSQNTTMLTDSVGMQLIRRDPISNGEVQANYYPMPTATVLDDRQLRLSVLSNLEHGCMQYKMNGVEIMLDRMLNQDDGKGLGSEADGIPDDLKPVDMKFTLLLERVTENKKITHFTYHSVAAQVAVQTTIYPSIITSSDAVNAEDTTKSVAPLLLPCEYQLLTIRPLSDSSKHMMVIFRSGVECGVASMVNCMTNGLKEPLIQYLRSIGVVTVQRTNLGGTVNVGGLVPVDNLDANVSPMDFLVLVFQIGA